jgi:Polyketide cyclase / dehydrase and lipid transport
MPMEVRVVEEIAAPADRVWAVIRGFGDLLQWADGLESCQVEGSGVGAVRTVGVAGGLRLQERLESFDEASRSFSYAIIGANPLPFRDYLSRVQLRETGPARCEITWEGRFEAKPGRETASQTVVRGIYTGSIASLRKKLGV